jgi:hypothetical protein
MFQRWEKYGDGDVKIFLHSPEYFYLKTLHLLSAFLEQNIKICKQETVVWQ